MVSDKLSHLVKIISGGTPKTSISEYWNGDIGWLSIDDFRNAIKHVTTSEKTITRNGLENSQTKILDVGDIIISARGTVGKLAVINKPMAFNQSCFGLRTKSKDVLQDYLFYYLKNHIKNITAKTQGSVFDTINLDTFDIIDVEIPDIQIQKGISEILSSFDTKIEKNLEILQTLESLAKTIYDYWFLQFDFPDEKGKPYKSSGGKMVWNDELKREIPEGWYVENIRSLCDVIDCLHSKKPDSIYQQEDWFLLELENLTSDGHIDLSSKYYISEDDYQLWTSKIEVKENDFVITNAGRAGAIGKIPKGITCALGRNFTAIRPKKINPYYLNQFLHSYYMDIQIKANLDDGAFFKSFNVKSIKEIMVLVPPKEIEKQLYPVFEALIQKTECLLAENSKITSLRDFLLPILMNGQVSVIP